MEPVQTRSTSSSGLQASAQIYVVFKLQQLQHKCCGIPERWKSPNLEQVLGPIPGSVPLEPATSKRDHHKPQTCLPAQVRRLDT